MPRVTVIETRYGGTGGVLIGTGARWLLLAAEPSPADVEALWSVLTRAGPAVDAIVGLLEAQHPLGLPSLALIDLSSGEVQSACRGSGGSRSTATPGCSPWAARTALPVRRLVGGVVVAGCARVRPARRAHGRGRRHAHRRRPGAHPRRDRVGARPRRRPMVAGAGLLAGLGGHRGSAGRRPAGVRPPSAGSARLRAGAAATPRRRPGPRRPHHRPAGWRPAPCRRTSATRRARRCSPCAARPGT